MRTYLLIGLLWLVATGLYGQNRPSFFKAMPPESELPTLPVWAQLMYAADPDVLAVDAAYAAYYRQHPWVKTLHTQNYRHWRRQVAPYLNNQGLIRLPTPAEEASLARTLRTQRTDSPGRNDLWRSLGPVETFAVGGELPISWQVNVYCLDQSASAPDILFAGTEGGGIFKTTNRGLSWQLVSANEDITSVTAVEIHPTNPDRVLAAANRRIFQTTDGGLNWQEVLFMDGSGYEIKYHPSSPDTIFCTAERGLYLSVDGGLSWTRTRTQQAWDLDFHPLNPNLVYLLSSNNAGTRAEFFRSEDGGFTWTAQTTGWYQPSDPAAADDAGGKIAVTAADPDRVYVALIGQSKEGDQGWIGVWRSANQGTSWTLPSGQVGGPYLSPGQHPWNVAAYSDGYHQGFYNFDFEASQLNANKIWIGTIRLTESANGGQTFQPIGAANSSRLDRIHADIQAIEVNGAEIWVASDGGINYSTDELISHTSRKYGIIGSDFWGFGAGWNEDVLVGGKYHNGNSAYYQTYGDGNYLHVGGVEEATGYVNPLDNRTTYFNQYWTNETVARRIPDDLTGQVINQPGLSLIPNESYVESSSSGLYFDPRYADHIVLGRDNKIWKSTDGGANFDLLHEFPEGKVYEIEISRANPDYLYCVVHIGGFWDGCTLYRSTDGGQTWAALSAVPGNRWRMEISLNPENENELWVALSRGDNGAMVFSTSNGGQTWTNRTSSILNGQRMKDIFYQAGTEAQVYLATNYGVYLWNGVEWRPYSTGLPFVVSALQMKPFYRDNKLRLATYGRGIWEAPLAQASRPLAQPMTRSNQVYCGRDTVAFDSYAVIAQEGATWEWTFSPAPAYLSDPGARNPKVVFGQEGNYTVTLTVTDAMGQSHSRTETNMVEVINYCEPTPVPGQAMQTGGNGGDFLQTELLGFTSNTFTVTAWVKPDGIQPDYTGIFMNDGQTAGFNFREGNNTLGYHWPGGAWWWDSNLEVPANEWSYVAMVATPTGVTLYVNGEGATHNFAVNPVLFETAKIGSYKGWGDRNYRGLTDEVTIWNRALSQEEIREWRHLTRHELVTTDPDLIAYYQFNEPTGRVNDLRGASHGQLRGDALRTPSTAPVGGGQSYRTTIPQAGVYALGETGVVLTFAQTDQLPGDEIVATRLGLLPDALPATGYLLDSAYWIINDYGDFPTLGLSNFQLMPAVGANQLPAAAGEIVYHQRTENEDGASWSAECAATELSVSPQPTVGFSDGCEVLVEGQFVLTTLQPVSASEPQVSTRAEPTSVYPNPVWSGQQLRVVLPQGQTGRLLIYSAEGRLMLDHLLAQDGEHVLKLDSWPAGSYPYVLETNRHLRSGIIQVIK